MKAKIIEILNKYKIEPIETHLTSDVVSESDFNNVAYEIIKLIAEEIASKYLDYKINPETREKLEQAFTEVVAYGRTTISIPK